MLLLKYVDVLVAHSEIAQTFFNMVHHSGGGTLPSHAHLVFLVVDHLLLLEATLIVPDAQVEARLLHVLPTLPALIHLVLSRKHRQALLRSPVLVVLVRVLSEHRLVGLWIDTLNGDHVDLEHENILEANVPLLVALDVCQRAEVDTAGISFHLSVHGVTLHDSVLLILIFYIPTWLKHVILRLVHLIFIKLATL